MSENKDYISRLNKARRNRNQKMGSQIYSDGSGSSGTDRDHCAGSDKCKSAVSGRVARGGSET